MDTYNFKKCPFIGVASALATPFENGKVDYAALRRYVEWQIEMGVDALVVSGTTGEAATLTRAERKDIATCAKEVSSGKVPLIVGCGSSDTASAITLCKEAKEVGADALLVITPYCNKGTAKGVLEHYKRIADAADETPIILYNVPSRTGVDLSFSQYAELAKVANIVAVKEAANSFAKITRIVYETPLFVYSGNDDMILPVISVGGKGVISVLSNIVPAAVAVMCASALNGDFVAASKIAGQYAHLVELLFAETNPAPLKYAMSLLEICTADMRLPMGDISEELKLKIKDEMIKLSLI